MSFSPDHHAPDASAPEAAGRLPVPAPAASAPKARGKGHPVGVKATGLREKAWRTIRHLHYARLQFTLNELLDINATGTEKDAPSNLLKYLARLEQHGVIVRLARRVGDSLTSPGYVVWRLANDLGWDAPVWRNVEKVLWNPNKNAPVELPATSQPGQGGAL